MAERVECRLGEHRCGALRLETAQAKAEWILREELARLDWGPGQLELQSKSDPQKLGIAARRERH